MRLVVFGGDGGGHDGIWCVFWTKKEGFLFSTHPYLITTHSDFHLDYKAVMVKKFILYHLNPND